MYSLVNPPDSCRVPETEPGLSYFQAEVKELYQELLLRLSPLYEGSVFGVSDYAVRPHPKGDAPPERRFVITILSQRFLKGHFLQTLLNFLRVKAPPYCCWVEQEVNPDWRLAIFLDVHSAKVFCDNETEYSKVEERLSQL